MFFISEIGLDILKDALENCIIFLVWAAWVLCNSYLTQKQRFSVCSFKKMPPSSPPVGNFCLDIQEYISLTRLTFPKSKNNNNSNNKKHEKNGGTKENFKYREDVCFTAYLLCKC